MNLHDSHLLRPKQRACFLPTWLAHVCAGFDVTLPVPLDVKLPVASYQSVVGALDVLLNQVDATQLGNDRTLMLPSISSSPAELYAAAAKVAGEMNIPRLGEARAKAQEVATRIVTGMGSRSDGSRAEQLGLPRDVSAEYIVRAYAHDYVIPALEEGSR
jgi:hypothetical protein